MKGGVLELQNVNISAILVILEDFSVKDVKQDLQLLLSEVFNSP